jgi:polysaccharide pyruvyl transferase WcaK-like protein
VLSIGPNILLSTLFSNTLSLCSSLNVRDQVSHPYRTTGKIIAALKAYRDEILSLILREENEL